MRLSTGPTEDTIKGKVKRFFDRLLAWSYAPTQGALGVHGIPDRVACVPMVVTQEMVGRTVGLFAAVECKRPGRRTEKLAGHKGTQVQQIRDMIGAHGIAITCDGDDDLNFLEAILADTRLGRPQVQAALLQRFNNRIEGRDK